MTKREHATFAVGALILLAAAAWLWWLIGVDGRACEGRGGVPVLTTTYRTACVQPVSAA